MTQNNKFLKEIFFSRLKNTTHINPNWLKEYKSHFTYFHVFPFYKNCDQILKNLDYNLIHENYLESFQFRKAYQSYYLRRRPLQLAYEILTFNPTIKDNFYFTEPFEDFYVKYEILRESKLINQFDYNLLIEEYAREVFPDHIATDFNTIELNLATSPARSINSKFDIARFKKKKIDEKILINTMRKRFGKIYFNYFYLSQFLINFSKRLKKFRVKKLYKIAIQRQLKKQFYKIAILKKKRKGK